MDSLIAHLTRKERERLSVTCVDVDAKPELAEQFRVDAGLRGEDSKGSAARLTDSPGAYSRCANDTRALADDAKALAAVARFR